VCKNDSLTRKGKINKEEEPPAPIKRNKTESFSQQKNFWQANFSTMSKVLINLRLFLLQKFE
jgi:hypothetical protein